jgi:hypothetical protein
MVRRQPEGLVQTHLSEEDWDYPGILTPEFCFCFPVPFLTPSPFFAVTFSSPRAMANS